MNPKHGCVKKCVSKFPGALKKNTDLKFHWLSGEEIISSLDLTSHTKWKNKTKKGK